MAEGDIGAVIDSLEFIDADITHPNIVHVSGDIYAIVYADVDSDGWIITVDIDAAGQIGASVIDTLEFDSVQCLLPDIIHVSGDIYAIAYGGVDNDGFVCTVDIDAAGQIGAAVIDSMEFDTDNCNYAHLIHVSGDIYAIAYQGPANDGYVCTVDIATDGDIGAAIIDSMVFEGTYGSTPRIAHVVGNTFAIVCTNSSYQGVVHTIGIDVVGEITNTVLDSLVFSVGNGMDPYIIHVSGDIYAIAYRDGDGDGVVCTVDIDAAGQIGAAVIDSLEFDTDACNWPCLLHVSGDVYAIAYKGASEDGFIITVDIDAAGEIGAAVIDSLEFDTSTGDQPSLIHVSDNTYAIAYMGGGSDGFVITLGIDTVPPSRPKHFLMMGIG